MTVKWTLCPIIAFHLPPGGHMTADFKDREQENLHNSWDLSKGRGLHSLAQGHLPAVLNTHFFLYAESLKNHCRYSGSIFLTDNSSPGSTLKICTLREVSFESYMCGSAHCNALKLVFTFSLRLAAREDTINLQSLMYYTLSSSQGAYLTYRRHTPP